MAGQDSFQVKVAKGDFSEFKPGAPDSIPSTKQFLKDNYGVRVDHKTGGSDVTFTVSGPKEAVDKVRALYSRKKAR